MSGKTSQTGRMARNRLRPALLVIMAMSGQAFPQQPAGWPRATPLPPGSPSPQQPYAAWPEDQAERMRQLNLRFCANLRMALRGQPFPFADDAACIARQQALLPMLCSPEGRSLRRSSSFCFSAVNTDMRSGLNSMTAVSTPAAGAAQAAAGRPAPATPLRLVENPLPMPRQPGPAGGPELSAAAVFRRAEASIWVVMVEAGPAERGSTQGSGVAISPRLLLTNCHVVRRGGTISLRRDGRRNLPARIAHADLEGDRCVLQTEEAALTPIAGVRPHAQLQVGERAYAIGAPLGLTLTLTEGIISATRHGRGQALVQSSAATSFGSSGGGLFDSRGNLVGITTFGIGTNSAFNFAIAAEGFWQLRPGRRAAP